MLVEARATGYVYHAGNDQLEVRASGPSREGSGKEEKATLLLDGRKKLVGVDLRGTEAGCVLMLGAHEDVESQADARVRVELLPSGELLCATITGASKNIEAPGKNAY